LSCLGLKFQVNRISVRHINMGQQRLYEFCYLLPFNLWASDLSRIIFLKWCGSLFWESTNSTKIFNGLKHSFQVWLRFINVSESFSFKDSSFILLQQGKKISELILPSNLILLAYMEILKGEKSDPIIFRILNSDLLLLLLFSS